MNLFEYKTYGFDKDSKWNIDPVVIPCSINPIHHGHTSVANYIERIYGPPIFEISPENVDKNVTDYESLAKSAVLLGYRVIILNAKTFAAKAIFYENFFQTSMVRFAVGVDTWNRLFEYKYYPSNELMNCSLESLGKRSQFYILPRDGIKPVKFEGIKNFFESNFVEIDISSTQIREINGTV